VMLQNFVEDVDIGSEGQVLKALTGLVENPAQTFAEALNPVNKPLLRQYTQEAQQRGIFGAPMMWVGNELFWGDDRLEEAIELAVRPGADQ
jgi:2-hydroxychromene-2-carboxylate isomerase